MQMITQYGPSAHLAAPPHTSAKCELKKKVNGFPFFCQRYSTVLYCAVHDDGGTMAKKYHTVVFTYSYMLEAIIDKNQGSKVVANQTALQRKGKEIIA